MEKRPPKVNPPKAPPPMPEVAKLIRPGSWMAGGKLLAKIACQIVKSEGKKAEGYIPTLLENELE